MSPQLLRTTVAPSVALVILWSSGFIGAELGTREAPASAVLWWRYLVAAAILVAICAWRRVRFDRHTLGRQVVLGLLIQVAYLGLIVGGVGLGAAAGTTSLIASLQPLVVIALAVLALGERARRAQLVGLALGLVGVILVVGGDLSAGGAAWWVYLLPVGGMLALSCGTVLEQRWQPPESMLVSLTIQTLTGAVAFSVLALVDGTTGVPTAGAFWVAIAWVVLLSSFGGYGSYLYVTRTQGATRASTWLYLTPPTTMLWAALMFGDRVSALGLAGLAVAAVGVAVALRPPAKVRTEVRA
ncbi:DMT family transporter [Aeromicrobium chenweiae]|uniref:EamA family transporter n=1 Tax=Aeromicrobium chenweiae TaxID=2079793 RepID=A0A2S0WLZ9_9ACTN|nr:DMT family transporter [Aeromicrobium chenweiae]AWB92379.1 EamA family transporter [Aeromicrobium chenweiae]TGN31334.1 DMT family transporter [Aeromicrobium chenweiae]